MQFRLFFMMIINCKEVYLKANSNGLNITDERTDRNSFGGFK